PPAITWPPPHASRARSRPTHRSPSASRSGSSTSATGSTSRRSSRWSSSRRASSSAPTTCGRVRARPWSAGRRASPDAEVAMAGWNVLATSLEGQRDTLLELLRRFGRFRGAGYRNVVVGHVDDVPAFLDRVRDALAADPFLPRARANPGSIEKQTQYDPRHAAT